MVALILVGGWLGSQYMAYKYQKEYRKDLTDACTTLAEAISDAVNQWFK